MSGRGDKAIHRPSGRTVTVLAWPDHPGVVKVEFPARRWTRGVRRITWVPQGDLDRIDSHR